MIQGSRKTKGTNPTGVPGPNKKSRRRRSSELSVAKADEFICEPAYALEVLTCLLGEFTLLLGSNGVIEAAWTSSKSVRTHPEALLGRTLGGLLGRDTSRHLSKLLRRVRESPAVECLEYAITLGNEERWFCARALGVTQKAGKPRDLCLLVFDITGRKKDEQRLVRSEALLGHAAQLANVGSWETDLRTDKSTWSEEMYRIIGLEAGADHRERFWQMIHPDDQHRMRLERCRAISQNRPMDSEFRLNLPDGQLRYFQRRMVPICDEAGVPVRLVGMTQDITERKQVEEKLQKNAALLAQAAQLANMGSWERDLRTNKVVWSDEMYRILGLDPQKCVTDPNIIQQMIVPEDREKSARDRDEGIACRRPLDCEFRVRLPGGQTKILHRRAVAIYDEKGKATRLVGMTQDVTERKKQEEQLRSSAELLAQAEEIANLGSWEFNPKDGANKVSKTLMRMYGFCPEELWDESRYWKCLDPADHGWIRETYEKSISESKPFAFTAAFSLPDGTKRLYLTQGIPEPGEDGTANRIRGVVQDVTEQRQIEQDLHHLSQQLLRTRDTERRNLARELHETAGQSLSSLKMVLGRLRDLLPEDDERARSLLGDCDHLAEDAVREVRVVSYLMHPPLLDEGGLQPAICWLARGFSERSGVQVQLKIPEDLGRFSQETETTVFRVVQEALTNVHRYSGSRSVCIRVAREDSTVRAEIEDYGCGISPVSPPRTSSDLMGVGIAGMRERVRELNGEFAIESVPGRGTLVRAIVPFCPETNPAFNATKNGSAVTPKATDGGRR